MNTQLALANDILPLFRANTLRGLTRTCGYYAFASGRDADAVGHALHLIGAACVLACIPVAPIHFVEHVEDEWRGIFAIAASESIYADAWPLMCAAARFHAYSESDFELVANVFRTQLKNYAEASRTPLGLWQLVVTHAFAQAAERYESEQQGSPPPERRDARVPSPLPLGQVRQGGLLYQNNFRDAGPVASSRAFQKHSESPR